MVVGTTSWQVDISDISDSRLMLPKHTSVTYDYRRPGLGLEHNTFTLKPSPHPCSH